ncbi:hypothetical protein WA026_022985 [Henosepilachna vigintioctopunctata]|uniref:Uncharacterized protein n=1 Tax=Henosepilachna vigintioctopunctata TaxID=420089 RepID=A0AAW1UI50_9CUCU
MSSSSDPPDKGGGGSPMSGVIAKALQTMWNKEVEEDSYMDIQTDNPEASTLVKNSYASVVSTLPIHFGSSNKFNTNINKSPKRRLPDDSKLELKRKHSDIIKIIPSTSGNGVSLKQNFNEYNKENSTSLDDSLDLSFLSEVVYNLLLSLLKECSGSMSNIGDISYKNVIKNKLQELLNGKQT